MEIRQLPANEYDKALDLSLDVFIECGRKDFDEEGLETFKNFIYNKQLVNELTFYLSLIHIYTHRPLCDCMSIGCLLGYFHV